VLSTIQGYDKNPTGNNADLELEANLVLIAGNYDDKFGQVKVKPEVSASMAITKLAISYDVSILAELPIY
jgi:hypothetical protein